MKANLALMASSKIAERQHLNSIWKLGGLTPWQLIRNVAREIDEDDLLGRASGLAFNFLLAFFPLILFMLALFGLFASRSSQLVNQLLGYFADLLPPAAFQLLQTTTNQLATSTTGGKLTLGIVLALWFASGGIASMISTLNVVYRVRETRSWFKVRAIALGLTLAITILLFWALVMVLVGGHLVDWVGEKIYLGSTIVVIWKALEWPTALLFVTISFSAIYYLGPDLPKRYWHWITPGSLFGVFLWFAASAVFRGYLHFFNTYDATYGSLGAVMILLVWLYVAGLAFLIGGEINAEIERAANISLSGGGNQRIREE
jgi:membrane protein